MQMGIFKNFFILSLVLVLGGCLGKELPKIQHYELSLDSKIWNQDTIQKNLAKKHFIYQGTEASLKIAYKKIAYKANANTIDYFAKSEWIEPLPLMIDSLVAKAAKYSDVLLSESTSTKDSFKLQILDLYYDEKSEVVVLNLLVRTQDSNHLLTREAKVQSGGFGEIVEAMNQAINFALLDSFLLLH